MTRPSSSGAAEVCNGTDDNCDGVNNEDDGKLCPAGRTCDADAKMCVDISDAGADAGPAVDAGAPPDHITFESGCRCAAAAAAAAARSRSWASGSARS